MKVLIISRWSEVNENANSRTKLTKLSAVMLRNSFASERYLDLLLQPRAAELFSGFVFCLQVASACTPRGALIRDNGQPHTAETLAHKTHAPLLWFRRAIPYLLGNHNSHEPAWLTEVEVESADELAQFGCCFGPKSAAGVADSAAPPPGNPPRERRISDRIRHGDGGKGPPSVVLNCINPPKPPAVAGGVGESGEEFSGSSARTSAATAMRGRESDRTMPANLDTPEFRAAWEAWVGHLQSKHHDRVSLSTLDAHLEQCRIWGPVTAIAAITFCISSNFSRLEEPEAKHDKQHRPGPAGRETNGRAYASASSYAKA